MITNDLMLRWISAVRDGRQIISDALRTRCRRRGGAWSVLGVLWDLSPLALRRSVRVRWMKRMRDQREVMWWKGADGSWHNIKIPESMADWAELDPKQASRLTGLKTGDTADIVKRLEQVE